jgi:hypothetical protein
VNRFVVVPTRWPVAAAIRGQPAGVVERTEHDYSLWEKRVDAMLIPSRRA